jgi:hypothetical protein
LNKRKIPAAEIKLAAAITRSAVIAVTNDESMVDTPLQS